MTRRDGADTMAPISLCRVLQSEMKCGDERLGGERLQEVWVEKAAAMAPDEDVWL